MEKVGTSVKLIKACNPFLSFDIFNSHIVVDKDCIFNRCSFQNDDIGKLLVEVDILFLWFAVRYSAFDGFKEVVTGKSGEYVDDNDWGKDWVQ